MTGGQCRKTCSTLFIKHVFPRLVRPRRPRRKLAGLVPSAGSHTSIALLAMLPDRLTLTSLAAARLATVCSFLGSAGAGSVLVLSSRDGRPRAPDEGDKLSKQEGHINTTLCYKY